LIRSDELDELFAGIPRRFGVLRALIDARAESGPESLLRLMLRRLGCRFDVQVKIDGVGRVDFVVDGWLIVECDSEAHHGDWAARRRDLRRDQAAAPLGYSTFRPIAEDIMWNPDAVQAALRGLVRRAGRGVRF
jgi:very-short-patch-repair endonuclease